MSRYNFMCECNLLWKAGGNLFLWLGGCPVITNRDALCELIPANTDGWYRPASYHRYRWDNWQLSLGARRCRTCLLNHTNFIFRFTLNSPLFGLMIYPSNKYHALLKRANRIKVIKLPTASENMVTLFSHSYNRCLVMLFDCMSTEIRQWKLNHLKRKWLCKYWL